jgi:hypothetical protein
LHHFIVREKVLDIIILNGIINELQGPGRNLTLASNLFGEGLGFPIGKEIVS